MDLSSPHPEDSENFGKARLNLEKAGCLGGVQAKHSGLHSKLEFGLDPSASQTERAKAPTGNSGRRQVIQQVLGGLRVCISNPLPYDADATGPQTTHFEQ